MGTSSDHSGGSGAAWTKARNGAGQWAGDGGGAGPGLIKVVADAAAALAGYEGTSAATSAAPGLARIGGLGGGGVGGAPDGHGEQTLADTLTRTGLDDLVGRNLDDVHDALVEYIAGDPLDRDADLVRSAADEAVAEALEGADIDDLDAFVFDQATVERMMDRYLTEWLTRLVSRELGTVITDQNPQEADRRSAEIREYVTERLANVIDQQTVTGVDWSGPDGTAQARAILNGAREVFLE